MLGGVESVGGGHNTANFQWTTHDTRILFFRFFNASSLQWWRAERKKEKWRTSRWKQRRLNFRLHFRETTHWSSQRELPGRCVVGIHWRSENLSVYRAHCAQRRIGTFFCCCNQGFSSTHRNFQPSKSNSGSSNATVEKSHVWKSSHLTPFSSWCHGINTRVSSKRKSHFDWCLLDGVQLSSPSGIGFQI